MKHSKIKIQFVKKIQYVFDENIKTLPTTLIEGGDEHLGVNHIYCPIYVFLKHPKRFMNTVLFSAY
jgi:hypothetical protein